MIKSTIKAITHTASNMAIQQGKPNFMNNINRTFHSFRTIHKRKTHQITYAMPVMGVTI